MLGDNVSLAALAEQQCRIEHKLDLLLRGLAEMYPSLKLLPMNSEEHICPVCSETPTHSVDVLNGYVVRKCGCFTGKLPFTALAPSITTPQQGPISGE